MSEDIINLSENIRVSFGLNQNQIDLDVMTFISLKKQLGYSLTILNKIITNHKAKILEITLIENAFSDDRFYTYGIVSLICRMSKFNKYTD